MSTQYEITNEDNRELIVVTHGGKLDIDLLYEDGYMDIASGFDPRGLAEIGFKLIRVAMMNDYSGENCGLNIEAFKKWAHERIDAL